jgi:hypothetical protein
MTAAQRAIRTRGVNGWNVLLIVAGAVALAIGVVVALAALEVPGMDAVRASWPSWMITAVRPGEKLGVMVFAVALFAAVMCVVLLAVDRARRLPTWAVVVAFVGPAVVITAGGLLYPMIRTIIESFFDEKSESFVGFGTSPRSSPTPTPGRS